MCKIGHITQDQMEILKSAFPEWTHAMQNRTYENFKEFFNEEDVSELEEKINDFKSFKLMRTETLRHITKSEIENQDKRRVLE